MKNYCRVDCRWIVIPIPFTKKELVISRTEWFGPIRILKKYEYVWLVLSRNEVESDIMSTDDQKGE